MIPFNKHTLFSLTLCGSIGLAAALPAAAGTFVASGKSDGTDGTSLASSGDISLWDVTAAVGLGLAKGNTDHLNLSAQFLATYVSPTDEFYFGADYLRTEKDSTVTGHNLHASSGYNRTLAGPFYLGIAGDAWYDEIADVDYRLGLSPTLGFHLIKNDRTLLALEGGVGYLWEKQGGVTDDYVTARFAQRFSHKFAGGVVFTESVGWVTELDDFSNNWLLVADAGLQVPLSRHWALGTNVRYTYDNTPAFGFDNSDLAVLATLNYSLKGFAPAAAEGRRSLKPAAVKPAELESGWSNTAAVGFSLTSGNTETLLATADYASIYRNPGHELFFNLGGAYGETGSSLDTQNFRAGAQYNKLLGERFFVGSGAGFLYDEISAVDYRVSPFVSFGAYLVKTDTAKLSLEAGPSYVWEKVAGVTDDYVAVQAAEKFSVALSDTVSFNQSLVYSAEASDLNNYTLTGAATLDVDVTENLSFRTGLSVIYDHTPAPGLKSTDTLLTAGLAVRF